MTVALPDIHPELRSIRGVSPPTNPLVLGMAQRALSAVNTLHRLKFKSVTTRVSVPSSDGYAVPAVLIRAKALPARAPALVYYHGGAFVMKPIPQHFENAVRYADEAGCVVVFVEYRLAPKYRFPAGFNDCYAALRWVLANSRSLGVDETRVAVGGDSAGGGLAAGVAQRARQEDGIALCGQLLLYPAVDLFCTRPSMAAYANVPPFKNASPTAISDAYLGPVTRESAPRYACPIDGDVSQLARAYVEVTEFDLLHDQGHAYARAMSDKGVEVELNEIERGVHGFDLLAASSNVAKTAMERRIRFLQRLWS